MRISTLENFLKISPRDYEIWKFAELVKIDGIQLGEGEEFDIDGFIEEFAEALAPKGDDKVDQITLRGSLALIAAIQAHLSTQQKIKDENGGDTAVFYFRTHR